MSRLRSTLAALAASTLAMLGPGALDAFADETSREAVADPDAWRFRAMESMAG